MRWLSINIWSAGTSGHLRSATRRVKGGPVGHPPDGRPDLDRNDPVARRTTDPDDRDHRGPLRVRHVDRI